MAVYLVQRVDKDPKFKFAFDYMGSAEFEFGSVSHTIALWKKALEESLIEKPLLFQSPRTFATSVNGIKNEDKNCWIAGTSAGIESAKAIFTKEIERGIFPLKERTLLFDSYKKPLDPNMPAVWLGLTYPCHQKCYCNLTDARVRECIFAMAKDESTLKSFMRFADIEVKEIKRSKRNA